MDNPYTFLELPLDRDLYKPKKILKCDKPPLRVLLTEAGTNISRHLMYKICTGTVFGPDQPVILHLVNARGCVDHKATLLDLEECGFSTLADTVVSAEPEISYGDVDVVILIALFEHLSGHNAYNSFLCQLNKARNVARNTVLYAKPNVKLIVSGPSTKGSVILLTCIAMLEPHLKIKNLSSVVYLDETLTKAFVAAQTKTTTDKIKNVTIWGTTVPDLHNATIYSHVPEDKTDFDMQELPLMQILENHNWIYAELIPKLFKRVLSPDLIKYGGAVASATVKHLRVLFQDSNNQKEIITMGAIVPPSQPYGLKNGIGFSLPVQTNNGEITVLENVSCAASTHVMILKSVYSLLIDPKMAELHNIIQYIRVYEETTKKIFLWNQHTYLTQKVDYDPYLMRYIISPANEAVDDKEVTSKKSITWEDANSNQASDIKNTKSILRFNIQ